MKRQRFGEGMFLRGWAALCTLTLAVAGIAVVGVAAQGCSGGGGSKALVEVRLTWVGKADVDLHVWIPNGDQCSQDGCPTNGGFSLSPDDTGEGENGTEVFSARDSSVPGRYRVGVNLHTFNPPAVPGPREVRVMVTKYHYDPPHPTIETFGPYTLTVPIEDGGYPVTGDTASWWRPVDFTLDVTKDDPITIHAPDYAPMNF